MNLCLVVISAWACGCISDLELCNCESLRLDGHLITYEVYRQEVEVDNELYH